jgi:hypothetical protein
LETPVYHRLYLRLYSHAPLYAHLCLTNMLAVFTSTLKSTSTITLTPAYTSDPIDCSLMRYHHFFGLHPPYHPSNPHPDPMNPTEGLLGEKA